MDNRLKPSPYIPSRAAKSSKDNQDPSVPVSAPVPPPVASVPGPGTALASSSRPVSVLAPVPRPVSGVSPLSRPLTGYSPSRPVSGLSPLSRPVSGLAPASRPGLVPSTRPVSGLAALSRPVSSLTSSRPTSLAPRPVSVPAPNAVVDPAPGVATDTAPDVVVGPAPDTAADPPPAVAVDPIPDVVIAPATDPGGSEARDAADSSAADRAQVGTDGSVLDQASDTTGNPAPGQAADAIDPLTLHQAAHVVNDPTPDQALAAANNPAPEQASDAVGIPVPPPPPPPQVTDPTVSGPTDRALDTAEDAVPRESAGVAEEEAPVPETVREVAGPDQVPDIHVNPVSDPAQGTTPVTATLDPPTVEAVATVLPRGSLEPTPVPDIDAATHIVVEHHRSGTVKTHVFSSKDGQPSLLGHVDPESIIDTISTTLDGKLLDLNALIKSSLEATKRESLDNTEALRAALEQNESHVANHISLAANRNLQDQIKSEIVPRLDRIEALLAPSGSSGDNVNANIAEPLDRGQGGSATCIRSIGGTLQAEDGDGSSQTSMEPMDRSVIGEPDVVSQDQAAQVNVVAEPAQVLVPPDDAQPVILEKLTAMETQVDALYKVVVEGQVPQNVGVAVRDGGDGVNNQDGVDPETLERLNAIRDDVLDFPESLRESTLKLQKLIETLEANPAIVSAREPVPEPVQGLDGNATGALARDAVPVPVGASAPVSVPAPVPVPVPGTVPVPVVASAPAVVDPENQATQEQWQAEYDDLMAALSDGLENRDLHFEALDASLRNMENKFRNLEGVNKLNLRASLRYIHMIYSRIDSTDARVHAALNDIQSLAEIAPERCTQLAYEMDAMRHEVLTTLASLPDTIVNQLLEASHLANNASADRAMPDDDDHHPVAGPSSGLGSRTRDLLGTWAAKLSTRSTSAIDANAQSGTARAVPESTTEEAPESSPTGTDLERRVEFIEQHLDYNPARAAAARGGAGVEAIPDGAASASESIAGEHTSHEGLAPEVDIVQELDVIQRGLMDVTDRQIAILHGTERIVELIEDQERGRGEERARAVVDHETALPALLDTTDNLTREVGDLKTVAAGLGDRIVDCHNDVRNLLQGSMHDSDLLSAIKAHFEGRNDTRVLTDELLRKAGDAMDMAEDIKALREGALAHQDALQTRLNEFQIRQDQGIAALMQKQDYSWLALNDKQERYHEAQMLALERCCSRCSAAQHTPPPPTKEYLARSDPNDDGVLENPFGDIPEDRRIREQQALAARNLGDDGLCPSCGQHASSNSTTDSSAEAAAEVVALHKELEDCRAQHLMLAEEMKEADHTVGKLMVSVMDKDQEINSLKAAMDDMTQDFERQQLARDQEAYNLNAKLDKKKQELKDMKKNMEWWLLEGLGLKPDAIAEASGSRPAVAEHPVRDSTIPENLGDGVSGGSDYGVESVRDGNSQPLPRHILMTEAAAELRQTLEEHRMQVPGLLAEIRELEERKAGLLQEVAQLEYQRQAQADGFEPLTQPDPTPAVDAAEGGECGDDSEAWSQRTGRERLKTMRRARNVSLSRPRAQSCHRSQSRGPSGLNPYRGGGVERVPQLEVDVKVCKDGDISETLFSNKAVLTQEQFERVRSNRNSEEQDDEVWSMFCDIKVRMVPFPPLVE